ncbi:cache domain-containing sensor histidine kinase [Robinsoniella sp. KNHs210]|uniref:cache domain-containing sensor histidine kinase n=1 Tax=Robinsoniella sp. KNHs210 TaxID=1469950 RepID=UPI0006941BA9|nr:sensor histidine kinase [Robinsoniella sp. KNHs210]
MNWIRKWFDDCGLRTKLLTAYIVLALFPMILITIFTYSSTKNILMERMHNDIDADLDQVVKSLDGKMNGYNAIMNMLYMDRNLHNYLTADYTNRGFDELYFYVDELFSSLYTLYPDIRNVSVYSTNNTLPSDRYYFYPAAEAESEKWYQHIRAADGLLAACGTGRQEAENETVRLGRVLNLYESGEIINVMKIDIDPEALNSLMKKSDDSVVQILTDYDGKIIASSKNGYIGKQFEQLRRELNIDPPDEYGKSSSNASVMNSKDSGYLGKMISIADNDNIRKQARESASRVIFVFLISSGAAVMAIYIYCTAINKKVQHVVKGAQAIGQGQFGHRLDDLGKDEFGVIANEFNLLSKRLEVLINESYHKEILRKSSELNLLQEQINPHFLYNSLSSISYLAMRGETKETNQAIQYLSDFYRISLNKGNQILTVGEEIQLLKSYLKIQDIRFESQIRVVYQLEEQILNQLTIKLVLQPIVENAIHHGRRGNDEQLTIEIRVFSHGDRIVFEVMDDGRGIEPEQLFKLQNSLDQAEGGYGLKNVNVRIRLNYGEDYGVFIESEAGFGTKVRIEVPGKQAESV